MIEALILTLIYICIAAVAVYLVLWMLSPAIPPKVVQIIWIIFALVVLLLLLRVLLPTLGVRLAEVAALVAMG